MDNTSGFSNCSSMSSEPDIEWSLSQLIWTLCFGLILVVSILGNCIVLWIILAHRTMWSVTNYFLVNLTLADLMMSILNCIPSFIFMRDRVWIFGSVYCKVNNYVSYMTVSLNVFTLLAISVDRRKAIVRPLAPKSGRVSVLLAILSIWAVSGALAAPAGLFSQQVATRKCSKNMACILVWPDGYQGSSHMDYIYNILFFFLTYVLPMLGMAVCYTQMGRNLWTGSKSTLSLLMPQAALTKSRNDKKKIVKMFAFTTVIFMVCWAPYHIYFIISYHYPSITRKPYIGHVYLAFYWLAMSNTCVNPIIYYVMNTRFRAYFNQVLCCVPNCITMTAKTQWNRSSQRRDQLSFRDFYWHNRQGESVRTIRPKGSAIVSIDQERIQTSRSVQSPRYNGCPPPRALTMSNTMENIAMVERRNMMNNVILDTNLRNFSSLDLELEMSLTCRYRSEVLL